MLKLGLAALVAMPLTFATAEAFDNTSSDRAAAAFGQYGLQGLAVAGSVRNDQGFPPVGPYEEAPAPAPVYTPRCWTQYVTTSTGNTLFNMPVTVCQ